MVYEMIPIHLGSISSPTSPKTTCLGAPFFQDAQIQMKYIYIHHIGQPGCGQKVRLFPRYNVPNPRVMKLPIKTQKKIAMMFPGCHTFPVEGLSSSLYFKVIPNQKAKA